MGCFRNIALVVLAAGACCAQVLTKDDVARVVEHPEASLAQGAIRGWDRRNQFYFQLLKCLGAHYGFELDTPYENLPAETQEVMLNGSGGQKIRFQYIGEKGNKVTREHAFEGIIPNLDRRYRETDSVTVREELAKYLNNQACPECKGTGQVTQTGGRMKFNTHLPGQNSWIGLRHRVPDFLQCIKILYCAIVPVSEHGHIGTLTRTGHGPATMLYIRSDVVPYGKIVKITMMYLILKLGHSGSTTLIETHLDAFTKASTPGLKCRSIGMGDAVAIIHAPIQRIPTEFDLCFCSTIRCFMGLHGVYIASGPTADTTIAVS